MIEDEIFKNELDSMGIKRTKDMYRKAKYLHYCLMCGENIPKLGWVLKEEYVEGYDTPYIFICNDCYEELD